MRVVLFPALAAAAIAVSPVLAAQSATGTVKAYDTKAMTLTLDNGDRYTLPQSFKDPGLKVGEKVKISWDMQGAKRIADTVTLVK
ncbi:MAG: DUF1344 domain-containing protein [Brucellaceae bacterium]|nr:DUF1344 domain-containing protein [Brucellaceae bacterium]